MAVKTFGSEILTSSDVNTYLANAGLVYITQTSFSAVSSVTVQSCFSSSYTNYVIMGRLYTTAADSFYQNILGTTAAATNYNYAVQQGYPGVGVSISKTTATTQFVFTSNSNGAFYGTVNADIFSPYVADATGIQIAHTRHDGAYTNPAIYQLNGNHSTATSYDGFKLNVASGTMTGALWVYGRRNT